MKQYATVLYLLTCLVGITHGQPKKGQIVSSLIPDPAYHYKQEYTFDITVDSGKWISQKPGLNVAFGSTDELYLRCEVPQLPYNKKSWEETGWRGERLNAQILVWSPDTLNQVRVKVNDLVADAGQVFSKTNINWYLVRYVLSDHEYASVNTGCWETLKDTGYLMPDRMETCERFNLPGNTVRPVWLSVEIPESTLPGIYRGKIDIDSERQHEALNIILNVQQLILPPPQNWTFRLDLWQNPWVIARFYQVEPWSDEHKMLLKRHLRLYAEAGGKFVTTYAVHSPWSDNSYWIEEAMIDWTKSIDGSWKFDYSIFDQYVQLAEEAGIDQAITIYTPVPWEYRFRFFDERTGNYIYEKWPPDSEEYKKIWDIFLDDLKVHLKSKNWFGKTYLGINENPLDVTMSAIKVIRDNSPEWKITYAGDWRSELSPFLDDYCTVIKSEPDQEGLMERKSLDNTSTFYVCCAPPQPNNFVFSPPVESRYIGWYAAAYGYDGFLRWAYDAWPADPMRDARHTYWPAGDCFMVYPGGNSSIRFEKLREGIADYEKLRVLKELASKVIDNKEVKGLMTKLDNHLKLFISDPEYSLRNYDVTKMTEAIRKGKLLVNELSVAMGHILNGG